MARLGKLPVKIPNKVQVSIKDNHVHIKGPKGELSLDITNKVLVESVEDTLVIKPALDNKNAEKLHGTYRKLLSNMVEGVSDGFEKKLELQGVGFRSQVQGKSLILNVGFSHQVTIESPPGINLAVENNTNIIVSGIDKQLVGQIAANIKSVRPPEPYKGKGIRYAGEYVRRKVGKAGK
uniref:Large ribosomal subunit protein uL6c n=1 Tax=Rhodomonas salina TaxID=3034 RepID=A6MW15_RHDSA|nr:ribosomal protein L6 [Rhodomonas salina]ABO70778.1 ribosomal protein L6 [Rhodomonas salina]